MDNSTNLFDELDEDELQQCDASVASHLRASLGSCSAAGPAQLQPTAQDWAGILLHGTYFYGCVRR